MTLTIHTAPVSYAGPDRFDVTRGSGGPAAHPFAPSWSILRPALGARRAGRDEQHWPVYVEAYAAEMRESYLQTDREAWRALLARDEVTLVCYCVTPERCHRTLLAGMLVKLGATYAGERR